MMSSGAVAIDALLLFLEGPGIRSIEFLELLPLVAVVLLAVVLFNQLFKLFVVLLFIGAVVLFNLVEVFASDTKKK